MDGTHKAHNAYNGYNDNVDDNGYNDYTHTRTSYERGCPEGVLHGTVVINLTGSGFDWDSVLVAAGRCPANCITDTDIAASVVKLETNQH